MNLKTKRANLLREAEALKSQDGTFEHDEARAAFDAKMAEIDALDVQIRAAEAQPAADVVRAEAVAAERTRGIEIRKAVAIAKLPAAFADGLVARDITLDAARAEILAKMAEGQTATETRSGGGDISFGEDAKDKTLRGMTNSLLVRSGMAAMVAKHEGLKASELDPGEFRGMTLLDVAKEYLTRAGVSFRGKDRMEIAGMAFRGGAYQTTSDFTTLLENTMHKVLRAAYGLQVDTWSRWCGIASVSDFRTNNWYRMGSLTELETLTEHGEFKNKSISDAEKATFSVATKGNIIAVTRQTIVNDDLGGMTRLVSMLGRAGKLTIENRVYALLGQNSGNGPTQTDSQPLFHSNRSNVGTSAPLSVGSLDADRVVMGSQKDPNLVDYIDLVPDVLLVPLGLGGQAKVINESQFDHDSTKLQKPNMVRGLFRDVIDTPRITVSSTKRYLFASKDLAPVFLVSFLEGQQEPVLETQDGWRTDGVELKARLDFGVDAVDYRGAVTNAGT